MLLHKTIDLLNKNKLLNNFHVSRFDYGGCAGNSNNFFTEGECLRKCVSGPQTGSMRGAREDGTPVRGFRGAVPSIPRDNVLDACAFPEDQGRQFS